MMKLCQMLVVAIVISWSGMSEGGMKDGILCPDFLTSDQLDFLYKNTTDATPAEEYNKDNALFLEGFAYTNFTWINNFYRSKSYEEGFFALAEGPKAHYDYHLCQYNYLDQGNGYSYSHFIKVIPFERK